MQPAASSHSFRVNMNSFKQICPNATQVMVCGWESCHYQQVRQALNIQPGSPIKRVLQYNVDSTIEGRMIGLVPTMYEVLGNIVDSTTREVVKLEDHRKTTRLYKAAMTSLALENYHRMKEGNTPIPLLFCIEASDCPSSGKTSAETILSKVRPLNRLITHSELRRLYKLCTEFEKSDDHELRELSKVARHMIKFVRLEKQPNGSYTFKEQPLFCDQKDWEDKWAARKCDNAPNLRKERQDERPTLWRRHISNLIDQILLRNTRIPIKNSPEFTSNSRALSDPHGPMWIALPWDEHLPLEEFRDI